MSKLENRGPVEDPHVGIRFTCRTCGNNRRILLVGLSTLPDDDGTPWYAGWMVEAPPAGFFTLLAHCREGHEVPVRFDRIIPRLESMKDEVGPGGQRVITEAR